MKPSRPPSQSGQRPRRKCRSVARFASSASGPGRRKSRDEADAAQAQRVVAGRVQNKRLELHRGSGARPEDYDMERGMFAAVAESLHRYDLVRGVGRDGSWWALFVCVHAERSAATCKLLMSCEVPMGDPSLGPAPLPEGYEIVAGDASQDPFIVRRKSDGFVMNAGLGTTALRFAGAGFWICPYSGMSKRRLTTLTTGAKDMGAPRVQS